MLWMLLLDDLQSQPLLEHLSAQMLICLHFPLWITCIEKTWMDQNPKGAPPNLREGLLLIVY